MTFRSATKSRLLLTAALGLAVAAPIARSAPDNATDGNTHAVAVALTGHVHSAKEGPMEGVLILAQRKDDPVIVSVATDAAGHFAFPADRLSSGTYQLTVRAVGYDMAPARVALTATAASDVDLQLDTVTDTDRLASQLTSLEWLTSFPGTDGQKDVMMRNMVNCAFCHSLERVARSDHDETEFLSVIQRMLTYETDHSSAERVQVAWPAQPTENLRWFGRDARMIAKWLASLNLSGGRKEWAYPLKTLPRPTGEATRAVVTVFPIPRQPGVVHDLDVDAQGNVWYGNTGWDYIGMLNPKTGKFREWPAPNFLPETTVAATNRIVGVQDVQVDGDGNVWVAVGGTKHARFNPKSGKWQTFDLPVIWRNPFLGPVRKGETGLWATGITGPADGTKRHENAFRLDIHSGQISPGITLFDDKPDPVDPTHIAPLNYCYMMDQDKKGDFLCTAPEPSGIIRADLRSGKSRFIPTPTPLAYPRRGYRDDSNRFWFGEFYADKIGVIDLETDKITEFPVEQKWISPYYARPDAKGRNWVSSTGSDRLLRLDPKTGRIVQYLMPVSYDARKVVVDLHADRTTIWLPNKNANQLVRVEISD